MGKISELAQQNLTERLKDNPCRGVVVGMNEKRRIIQLSWIMGRSPNSQNRIYVADEDGLRTEAADESKVEDPELIIYTAMKSLTNHEGKYIAHIVSNGDQTDTVWEGFIDAGITNGGILYDALGTRFCEPDAPTFTARVTGYASPGDLHAHFSVLKADPRAREIWLETIEREGLKREDFPSQEEFNLAVGNACGLNHRQFPTVRNTSGIKLMKGYGHCITTYAPGSQTLPPFEGEPFVVPVQGELETVMQTFWGALEDQWKVALGGKEFFDDQSYRMADPICKFEKVQGGSE